MDQIIEVDFVSLKGLKSKLICFHGPLSDPANPENHKCPGTVSHLNFNLNHSNISQIDVVTFTILLPEPVTETLR